METSLTFEAEIGVLKTAVHTESDVPRKRGVQAAADEGRNRGGLTDYIVCRPGFVGAAGSSQSLHKNRFSAQPPGVLPTSHDEVGVLWRAQIGPSV